METRQVYDVTEKVRKSVYEEPDREVTMASRVWVGGEVKGTLRLS